MTLAAGGFIAGELRYKPWGETRYNSGSTPTQRRYTGQLQDLTTGLYFYNARYYDPALGRFIQADTIVPEPGNPQSLNRYSYVHNNPLRYTDPSGYDPVDEEWLNNFEEAHSERGPEWYDYQIYLFSLAYQDEWHSQGLWSAFYNPDGSWKGPDAMFAVFRGTIPEGRSWDTMPDALSELASFYTAEEMPLFVQDVAFLYAGLPNRFQNPNMGAYRVPPQFAYGNVYGGMQVFINPGSIDPAYYIRPDGGQDGDANVHHWAWTFAMGYQAGANYATTANSTRERLVALRSGRPLDHSDLEIGGRGAQMGYALRTRSYLEIPHLFSVWLGVGP